MDETTTRIAQFVSSINRDDLSDEVIHETKRRFVDSVACAIGGLEAPPAHIARKVASSVTGTHRSATVLGLGKPTSIEMAAFANTIMVRYLDFNDMAFTKRGGGGHPSDLLASSLAIGEATSASGLDVILSAVVSYEVNGALAGAVWLRPRGWDQGLHVVAATAMSAGKLLGLDQELLSNALSLAVTPNIPTRQTRVGELSLWKGCATAGAARNGVFAALLAEQGMTGPPDSFEGKAGIWNQVTGEFDLTIPVSGDRFVIEEIATKMRPAEYNAQGPLDLVARLREKVNVDEIERIDVDTYFLAYDEIGSEPEKWDPHTRETADHSLAYLIAVGLVDGEINSGSFTDERILDPALRPLMNKIHIHNNEDFTAAFPEELNCRISVVLDTGENVIEHTKYPKGHPMNPATDSEINDKYDAMVAEFRPQGETMAWSALRDALWSLDEAEDTATVLDPIRSLSVVGG